MFVKDIVISPRKWKMLLFAYHAGEVKMLAVAHLYWLAIALEAWSLKPSSMKQKHVLTVLKPMLGQESHLQSKRILAKSQRNCFLCCSP